MPRLFVKNKNRRGHNLNKKPVLAQQEVPLSTSSSDNLGFGEPINNTDVVQASGIPFTSTETIRRSPLESLYVGTFSSSMCALASTSSESQVSVVEEKGPWRFDSTKIPYEVTPACAVLQSAIETTPPRASTSQSYLGMWPYIQTPPPLNIERVRRVGQFDPHIRKISGRRIVDIVSYTTEVRKLEDHECKTRRTGYMAFDSEKHEGLNSMFIFRCTACSEQRIIYTNPPTLSDNVNFAATWGMLSTGKSFASITEIMNIMEIPSMSGPTFFQCQQQVGDTWFQSVTKSMREAAQEEYDSAVATNAMDGDVGLCTVIVDGGWSHRSYGHSYNSNSGVACIIGFYTRKLLFLGIRNKYCCICAFAENKNVVAKQHVCYKNWVGSSTAMEADIISEGFCCSEKNYKLRYTKFIGDGDSSVHSKINRCVPYSRSIRKVDCANHLTKNLTKHLYKFSAESANNKRLMPATRINYIAKTARKLITLHSRKSNRSAVVLRADLMNVYLHAFGNHMQCDPEHCIKHGTSIDNAFENSSGEVRARLIRILGNLASKSESLLEDARNNLAEQFMHLVAKFGGGKQFFYGRRNSFNIRCYGAALSFNCGPSWIVKAWKDKFAKSPSTLVKRLCRRRQILNEKVRQSVRRRLGISRLVVAKKKKSCTVDDRHYGLNCEQPDMPEEQVTELIKLQINALCVNSEEQLRIAMKTVGQSNNEDWFRERASRLTASRFGNICKRRTNPGKLVFNMLYGVMLRVAAIEHGHMYESVAISAYEKETGNTVQQCGFFVCTEEHMGFLGASPDGLVGDHKLVEVKCPYTHRNSTPKEAAANKNFYLGLVDDVPQLKKTHNYYYQIQGQLYICKRESCDFIVWTSKGLFIQNIKFDESFIKKMLPKLTQFYFQHYGVELVDSRHKRSMVVRHSETTHMDIADDM